MVAKKLTFPLVPRRRIAGTPFGTMRAHRPGGDSDPRGSRPYNPGDDIGDIAWGATARRSAAMGRPELVVNEFFAQESVRVVVFVDRRPSMALYAAPLPWLCKPDVIVDAGRMIVDSAKANRSFAGYLDYARWNHPSKKSTKVFWRPPNAKSEARRIKERNLPPSGSVYPDGRATFYAPHDSVQRGLRELKSFGQQVPAESMIFVLSDFLVPPERAAWTDALASGWDVIPVIIQDPLWEQSFPDVSGVTVPIADPLTGAVTPVYFSRRNAKERRAANESRFAGLEAFFRGMGVDSVVLSRNDRFDMHRQFTQWSQKRKIGRRGLR